VKFDKEISSKPNNIGNVKIKNRLMQVEVNGI